MSYLVLECHSAYAIVLDNDGRFKTVANLRYTVGQRVDNVIEFKVEEKAKSRLLSLFSYLGSVFIALFTSWQLLFVPVGAVTMTINPSVKVNVNRLDYVLSVEGLNDDGADLVQDYHYNFKKVDTVTDEIAQKAIDTGYLKEDGVIKVSAESKNKKWEANTSDKIAKELIKYLNNNIEVLSLAREAINESIREMDEDDTMSDVIEEINDKFVLDEDDEDKPALELDEDRKSSLISKAVSSISENKQKYEDHFEELKKNEPKNDFDVDDEDEDDDYDDDDIEDEAEEEELEDDDEDDDKPPFKFDDDIKKTLLYKIGSSIIQNKEEFEEFLESIKEYEPPIELIKDEMDDDEFDLDDLLDKSDDDEEEAEDDIDDELNLDEEEDDNELDDDLDCDEESEEQENDPDEVELEDLDDDDEEDKPSFRFDEGRKNSLIDKIVSSISQYKKDPDDLFEEINKVESRKDMDEDDNSEEEEEDEEVDDSDDQDDLEEETDDDSDEEDDESETEEDDEDKD